MLLHLDFSIYARVIVELISVSKVSFDRMLCVEYSFVVAVEFLLDVVP